MTVILGYDWTQPGTGAAYLAELDRRAAKESGDLLRALAYYAHVQSVIGDIERAHGAAGDGLPDLERARAARQGQREHALKEREGARGAYRLARVQGDRDGARKWARKARESDRAAADLGRELARLEGEIGGRRARLRELAPVLDALRGVERPTLPDWLIDSIREALPTGRRRR